MIWQRQKTERRRWIIYLICGVFLLAIALLTLFLRPTDEASKRWWQEVKQHLSLSGMSRRLRAVKHLQDAQSALERQDWAAAEKALRQAVKVDPHHQEAWGLLTRLLVQQGRLDEAERLAEDVKDKQAQVKALLSLADAALRQRNWEAAEKALKRVAQVDPKNPEGHRLLLQEAQRAFQRQDWLRAEKALTLMVQMDPKSQEGWQLLMLMLVQQGRWDEAEQMAEQVKDPLSRATALLAIADAYYFRGDFGRAEAFYRKVLALDPDNAVALNNYGYMLAERGERLDEAEKMIRKALRREPNNYAFIDSLGWIYYQRGNYRKALMLIKRAVNIKSDDTELHYHLGMTYWRLGEREKAKRALEEALRLNPNHQGARQALDRLEQQEMEREMRGDAVRT